MDYTMYDNDKLYYIDLAHNACEDPNDHTDLRQKSVDTIRRR